MTSGVPWQVKGVRRQAREAAREAARRSGIAVGEWLDSVILDSALREGMEEPRRLAWPRYDPCDDGDPDRDEDVRPRCCLDKAVDTLRGDLAEIGRMLQEAMPRKAIEALESEVRKLADRVDNSRHAGGDVAALAAVERGLVEMRGALRALTPAESLLGVGRAVQQLSRKIDLIGSNTQDTAALRQLEGAIVAMRGIVSHVASNDALAKLSEEVRALAGKVDQAVSRAGGSILSALDDRIAMLADALEARNRDGRNVPHELEAVVKGLIDKIEQPQFSRGDHAALGHLQNRIDKLVEKLEASDARLNYLEAIERGLAELLIHLERQRAPNIAPAAASPPPEADALARDVAELRRTERKTQDSLEIVHGTLGHVVDRLAMIETDMRGKPVPPPDDVPPPPTASLAPAALTTPQPPASSKELATTVTGDATSAAPLMPNPAAGRRPFDPNLPSDHPLEPGSGAARGRNPASDRIAASEAALAGGKPSVTADHGGKLNFIAAARRAAQAAGRDVRAPAPSEIASAAGRPTSRVGKLCALIGAMAAILIVLGSLQIARTMLSSSGEAGVSAAAAPAAVAAPASAGEPAPPAPPAAASADRQAVIFSVIDDTTIATPAPGIVVPAWTPEPQPRTAVHVEMPPGAPGARPGPLHPLPRPPTASHP